MNEPAIPLSALRILALYPPAMTLLVKMLEEGKPEGMSRYDLEQLGLNRRTIVKALEQCMVAGVVERDKRTILRGESRQYLYRPVSSLCTAYTKSDNQAQSTDAKELSDFVHPVHKVDEAGEVCASDTQTNGQYCAPDTQLSDGTGVAVLGTQESGVLESKEEETMCAKAHPARPPSARRAAFERLWALYPQSKRKRDKEKAWERYRHYVKPGEEADCEAALARYVAEQDAEFIRAPMNFLSKRYWHDWYTAPASNVVPHPSSAAPNRPPVVRAGQR